MWVNPARAMEKDGQEALKESLWESPRKQDMLETHKDRKPQAKEKMAIEMTPTCYSNFMVGVTTP